MTRAKRLFDRVLLCGAAGAAVIFLWAVVVTFVRLLSVRHPNVGWTDNIVVDAKAVATGHFQYGNPAKQVVGFVYTPLYTWLFGGLLKIFWWEGWGPAISMLAVVGALVALVRMLWVATPRWEGRIATASVVVVLALGGLSAIWPVNGLYEARPDQLAWCLCVIAGTLVFQGLLSPDGFSRRRLVVLGLLFTASVFTKQTTIVTCVVLVGLTLVPMLVEPRRSWTVRKWFGAATALWTFAGTSALFAIVLQVASRGWAYDLLVRNPLRYGRHDPLGEQFEVSMRFLGVLLTVLVLLTGLVVAALVTNREPGRRRRAFVAVAAFVVAISPIPSAILAKAKLGGHTNQLLAPVWTITLACAVLLLLLRPSVRQLAASGIGCLMLLTAVAPFNRAVSDAGVTPARLNATATWPGISPFLQAAVDRGEAIYDWEIPSLSVSPKAPHYPTGNWIDQETAGYTPRYVLNNLLKGRYALVRPLPIDPVTVQYSSNMGRNDGSVEWKINLLLTTAYLSVVDPDTDIVYYKPSPELAENQWFAGCFGPWRAQDAGVDVRLRGDGGLLCIEDGALHLTDAPAPITEVVMKLQEGKGEASVRFAAPPTTLGVIPIDGPDRGKQVAAVADCLRRDGAESTLALTAVAGSGTTVCRTGPDGPTLEVPSANGNVQLSLALAALDTPTIAAQSADGKAVPFVVRDPTPADFNG